MTGGKQLVKNAEINKKGFKRMFFLRSILRGQLATGTIGHPGSVHNKPNKGKRPCWVSIMDQHWTSGDQDSKLVKIIVYEVVGVTG